MLRYLLAATPFILVSCGSGPEPAADTPEPNGSAETEAAPVERPDVPSDIVTPASAEETVPTDIEISLDLPDSDAVEFEFDLDPAITSFDPALAQKLADEGVREAVKFAKEASAEKSIDPDFFREWRLWRQWRLIAVAGDLGVVEQTDVVDAGGAHPNNFTESTLYERGGTELPIGALFTDDDAADERLRALFRDRLVEARIARAGEFMEEEGLIKDVEAVASQGVLGVLPTAPIASTEPGKLGGLIVHVNPYVVGPYAEGSYDILLPQEDFRSLLRPAYQDLFAGRPAPLEP